MEILNSSTCVCKNDLGELDHNFLEGENYNFYNVDGIFLVEDFFCRVYKFDVEGFNDNFSVLD